MTQTSFPMTLGAMLSAALLATMVFGCDDDPRPEPDVAWADAGEDAHRADGGTDIGQDSAVDVALDTAEPDVPTEDSGRDADVADTEIFDDVAVDVEGDGGEVGETVLTLEIETNDVNAEDPDGTDVPRVSPGEPVTWTYRVTNVGDTSVARASLTVTDSQLDIAPTFDASSDDGDDVISPAEVWIWHASAVAEDLADTAADTVAGCGGGSAYENEASVLVGDTVVDTAVSHYCNPTTTSASIEVAVEGADADDTASAPILEPGESIAWTFTVTNDGDGDLPGDNVTLSEDGGLTLTFDTSSDVGGDGIMSPGETWTWTATATAADLLIDGSVPTAPGCDSGPAYHLTANLTFPDGSVTEDTFYCNPAPTVVIEKSTNGADADDPDGADLPEIEVGESVAWSYSVTNTGTVSVPESALAVTDDRGAVPVRDVLVDDDEVGILSPGETWQWVAAGSAEDLETAAGTVPGCGGRRAYENTGTLTLFTETVDTDLSHYCNPPITVASVEVAVDGSDADDAASAPILAPGASLSWSFSVTNDGDGDLAGTAVVLDNDGGLTLTFDTASDVGGDGIMSPGETWTWTATGTAADLLVDSVPTAPGCDSGAAYRLTVGLSFPDGSATDETYYCNPAPAVSLDKSTEGADADDPEGSDVPEIAVGDSVSWTYALTNTGLVSLRTQDLAVSDDRGPVPTLDGATDMGSDGVLSPGEVWVWRATGVAEDVASSMSSVSGCGGRQAYENLGTATVFGAVATTDLSHYCNPAPVPVVPYYGSSAAEQWNRYVLRDGSSIFDASGAECDGTEPGFYSGCIHAGEIFSVEVAGAASCDTLSATDALGAFRWVCHDDGSAIEMVSVGLKPEAGLATLIDFDHRSWWPNSVTVSDGATEIFTTASSPWHDNPIHLMTSRLEDPWGIYIDGLGVVEQGMRIMAPGVAVVVAPGIIHRGSIDSQINMQHHFIWIEGTYENTGSSYIVRGLDLSHSMVRHVVGMGAITLERSWANRFEDIWLTYGADLFKLDPTSRFNTVQSLFIFGASTSGLRIHGNNNVVSRALVANSRVGVYVMGASEAPSNVLMSTTCLATLSQGLWISNADRSTVAGFATANSMRSVDIRSSANVQLRDVIGTDSFTASGAPGVGLAQDNTSSTTWDGFLELGNHGTDCITGITPADCHTLAAGAAVSLGVSLGDTFTGAVDDDAINPDDDGGPVPYSANLHRLEFESPWRGWGRDGCFASVDITDQCSTGDTCRVFDWALHTTDAVARDRFATPTTANAVEIVHQWTVSDAAECAAIAGATWASNTCTSAFIAHAEEISGDGIGNDNLLCEAGEGCLVTPNVGAYQGEGTLTDAGLGGPGGDVSLWRYGVNGQDVPPALACP